MLFRLAFPILPSTAQPGAAALRQTQPPIFGRRRTELGQALDAAAGARRETPVPFSGSAETMLSATPDRDRARGKEGTERIWLNYPFNSKPRALGAETAHSPTSCLSWNSDMSSLMKPCKRKKFSTRYWIKVLKASLRSDGARRAHSARWFPRTAGAAAAASTTQRCGSRGEGDDDCGFSRRARATQTGPKEQLAIC